MPSPTTGNDALDAVVSGLTAIIVHANKHIDRRMLLARLRDTPVPSEPVARTLYKMLNTLAENLPVTISTRSAENDNQADTSPNGQPGVS